MMSWVESAAEEVGDILIESARCDVIGRTCCRYILIEGDWQKPVL